MNTTAAPLASAFLASLVILSAAPASPPGSAAAPTEPVATTAAPAIDPGVLACTNLLKGYFTDGERIISLTPIEIEGAGLCLLGEFSRLDNPGAIEGNIVFQFMQKKDGLHLRTARFPGGARIAPGTWAAPNILPQILASRLDVMADLKVRTDAETTPGFVEAMTDRPAPCFVDRAVDLATYLRVDAAGMILTETGIDAMGHQVWKFPEGDAAAYRRTSEPPVDRRESGLIVVTLKEAPSDARQGQPGDTYEIHYTGWTPGGFMFDSSMREGGVPIKMAIPAPGGLIEGWNEGIPGMKVGEMRRLLVPGPLGYGARGNARANIPANSWLIFDLVCVSITGKDEAKPAGNEPIKVPTAPQ